jgi:hypothetical protein
MTDMKPAKAIDTNEYTIQRSMLYSSFISTGLHRALNCGCAKESAFSDGPLRSPDLVQFMTVTAVFVKGCSMPALRGGQARYQQTALAGVVQPSGEETAEWTDAVGTGAIAMGFVGVMG